MSATTPPITATNTSADICALPIFRQTLPIQESMSITSMHCESEPLNTEEIPLSPMLYLREVGFGFGHKYESSYLVIAGALSIAEVIAKLDYISSQQGNVAEATTQTVKPQDGDAKHE